jgi:asparagine synthase (glutamine-hydrolysing)
MLAAQQAYGPHDTAQVSMGQLALGRCLYRLLPEDEYDRQPVRGRGRNGRMLLVADVRLDNRAELAKSLGLERRSELSDADMLMACLERWDEAALDRVAGDFAFALWDAERERLVLARDPIGQRPLHYHCGPGFFAFATMPCGLHALAEIPRRPNEQRVAELLALMPEHGPASYFAEVERVEPGQVLTVTSAGISRRAYWKPSRPGMARRSDGECVEGLRALLNASVESRLRGAGRAVGAQLSAGFDSSATTATAARLLAPRGGKVVAFTSVPREGFATDDQRGPLADEGSLAGMTAARYPNVQHVLVRTSEQSPLARLGDDLQWFDRPSLNPFNMVWLDAINRLARERGLSVMFAGFAGNMTLSYAGWERLAELFRRGQLARLGREVASLRAAGKGSWRGLAGAALPQGLRALLGRRQGAREVALQFSALRADRLDALLAQRTPDAPGDGFELRLDVLTQVDPGNFNKGYLARWGVDVRDPLADKRLIEFCLALPMDQFLREGETRRIGRRALADRLPRAVLDEPRKGVQAADWFETLTAARGEIGGHVEELAASPLAAGTLDIARLRTLVREWPVDGWEQPATMRAYRLALLRGVTCGHFLAMAGRP